MSRVLAYADEQDRHHLTTLGRAGIRSVVPLPYVSGFGQLIRDLLSLDPGGALLGRWSALDHLLVMALLSDRTPRLRPFSESLAEQIDGWFEQRPSEEKSLLFGEWVMGAAHASKADELAGSLGLAANERGSPKIQARKRAYLAMLAALILDERSRGVAVTDLERRWALKGLEGIEESWRDTALWLLAGHAALCDLRCFYHHLREDCAVPADGVRAAKRGLASMRCQAFELLERIKYCSPLGPLLRGARVRPGGGATSRVGVGTIRHLEGVGITTMEQVARMNLDDLVAAGVQKRYARQVYAYMQRRLR